MNTRMENVTEDVAFRALQKTAPATQPPFQLEKLKEAFRAEWPLPDSNTPMKDAMHAAAQAASSSSAQDADTWETTMSQAWQPAVEEMVEEYFKAARRSFRKGEHLEAVETLTDAVRATLGRIAAVRNWPHGSNDNLYRITAALGSGSEWPQTTGDLDQALQNCSKEGRNMSTAFAASMGRPDMLKFGVYAENPDDAEEDGFLFATTAIDLANQLAGRTAS